MNSKKYIAVTLIISVIVLASIAAAQIIIDPLNQYHLPLSDWEPSIVYGQYNNPGIAKTFDYDTVILGSSMSANFRISWFDKAFKAKAVKLMIYGARSLDFKRNLEIIFSREQKPKRVIYELRNHLLTLPSDEYLADLPLYLYDNNILNDVSYYFNKEIWGEYSRRFIMYNLDDVPFDMDSVYVWDKNSEYAKFGKQFVLEKYERPEIKKEKPDIEASLKLTDLNLNNFLPYVQDFPDTEFIVHIPPYSTVFWDERVRENELYMYKAIYTHAFEMLLQYKNISLYSFTNEHSLSIISNLDKYRDAEHYDTDINQYMLSCFLSGENRVDKNNYKDVINAFFEFLENYDYDSIFD